MAWDVDGDGILEIVVVESKQQHGARLTTWSTRRKPDGQHIIELRAASDFIGTRFRWLALAGVADFTGDGLPEIA
ncbi:FG-GAP repeat domain-containing protein [Yoonia sp.]|uniref:FG-GAP repeat domain-containing protein n=1 Tax=Yoonia sp. TaxID=2212373 RepID=UPI003A4DA205